ncbi:MAG: DNA-directed RNA polymerase subunit alpha [Parcubacteria group bacterium Licking1014_17]|nr:MAG: DNA-directed RNA polymerase subunit alpha [Parcubacteria group bacterium Licking1014_17]
MSKQGNRAVFEVGPLYPGYGTTIGNTLRRVLISSLEGSAITSVKISGVDHEFSSMDGVKEDVVEIILNLKRVRFKLFGDEPVTLTLKTKGIGDVTAADIKTTSDVQVINKNQHIATITDKKKELEIELTIEKGIGYIPVEQRHKEKMSVGEIAVDGIFTPVVNINFTVENIRVMQRTDYNKVLLDIETDGSVTPEEAFTGAVDILFKHLEIIRILPGMASVDSEAEKIEDELISGGEKEEVKPKRGRKKKTI